MPPSQVAGCRRVAAQTRNRNLFIISQGLQTDKELLVSLSPSSSSYILEYVKDFGVV
jgi:hypothetical protein